jgi:protein SCO1/2
MRWFRRWLVLAGVAVAVASTAGCGDHEERALAGAVRQPALEVGDVTLPDVDGRPVQMVAPAGELLLAYFGYTSCPDVCPMTMSDIRLGLEALPAAQAERVTVAFVSVDPERDTPEVLTGYLDHFFDRGGWGLRTDDPAELASAARVFGVQYEVADHAPGTAYDVAHTATTYVIDDTGTVVVEWPFGFESDLMAEDLALLLDEEDR